MLSLGIVSLMGIDAVLEDYDWEFPTQHADKIDAIWQREISKKDQMFNGEVLLQHHGQIVDGVFHARYFQTRYKPFLAWMRMGCPPPAMRNGFAMAALRSADGAFLLGKMGAHTTNAGKIYFAAGTPDMNDIKGNQVDLYGSACRELCEETGLHPEEVDIKTTPLAVIEQHSVAFMFPARLHHLKAQEARDMMCERIVKQAEPELSDIVIIRTEADLDPALMPNFQVKYIRYILAMERELHHQG